MKIAFIGAGNVGARLATRLAEAGHEVTFGRSRDGSDSVAQALLRSPKLSAGPIEAEVQAADVVFLATPFAANSEVLRSIKSELTGKVLVDCTNPVGPNLTHGLTNGQSGAAFVQSLVPAAKVVKAFSIYGFENLENPEYPGYNVKPAMLFCSDDRGAKELVSNLIIDCGFEPLDTGGLVQALHLEHMTLLWIRMVRAGAQSPNLVWAALRR